MSLHKHWSHYGDEEISEHKLWDTVQTALDAGLVPAAANGVDTLVKLARSKGFGDADSMIHSIGLDDSNDDGYRSAVREQLENYMEGDYWSCIDRSQRLATDRMLTSVQRVAISELAQGMRDAYEEGWNERIAMEKGGPRP